MCSEVVYKFGVDTHAGQTPLTAVGSFGGVVKS